MQPIRRCVFTGRAEITVLGSDCIQKLMPAIHIPLILRALRVCFVMPGAFLRRIKLVPVVIYRNTPAGYLGMWLPSPCGGFCQAQSAQYLNPQFPDFTDCSVDGLYECAALTQWFWSQAEEAGGRFDRRNGCPNYQKTLRAVRRD